jgi:hypothetical protein
MTKVDYVKATVAQPNDETIDTAVPHDILQLSDIS